MLPAFGKIAAVGLAVDAPFIAYALIAGNLKLAVSLFAGWGLAVVVYGMLHLAVGRGLDLFSAPGQSSGTAGKTASVLGFVSAMIGKYVLIAALLFAAWRTGYLLVLPFLGAFILAQIGITWLSVAQSKKSLIGR